MSPSGAFARTPIAHHSSVLRARASALTWSTGHKKPCITTKPDSSQPRRKRLLIFSTIGSIRLRPGCASGFASSSSTCRCPGHATLAVRRPRLAMARARSALLGTAMATGHGRCWEASAGWRSRSRASVASPHRVCPKISRTAAQSSTVGTLVSRQAQHRRWQDDGVEEQGAAGLSAAHACR